MSWWRSRVKGRGLCPSCGAKRGAATAARLREEVLEAVGHAQWVFTVPKMLRPYFLRHRELLGDLCRAAWDTVREMLAAGAAEEIRPGMVAVVQTFGQRVNFHPHVHAIASRGGWRKDGTWVPVAYVDSGAAEKVFWHHVLSFWRKRGLIDEERVQLLLSWRHSGFSVHNSVVVEPEDPAAVERLIRYVMRAPVALERLHYDDAAGVMEIRSRPGSNDEPDGQPRERVDADELVARVIAQVPDPRRHLIHAYGWYANAARAKRKRDASNAAPAGASESSGPAIVASGEASDQAERRAARRRWADLIRRIYEVDPLVCSNCGGPMKIVAFITGRKAIRAILASMRKSAARASAGGADGILNPTVEVYQRTLELRARFAARLHSAGNWGDPDRGVAAER